jgi:hypothetical protein
LAIWVNASGKTQFRHPVTKEFSELRSKPRETDLVG